MISENISFIPFASVLGSLCMVEKYAVNCRQHKMTSSYKKSWSKKSQKYKNNNVVINQLLILNFYLFSESII